MKRRIFNRRENTSLVTHDHDASTKNTITSSSSLLSPLPIFHEQVKTHQTSKRKKRRTRINSYCFTFIIIFILIWIGAVMIYYIVKMKLDISSSNTTTTTITTKTKSTNNTTVWPHDTIHILNTRFMQHQPHLPTLAQARLHLFQTTCLPSITQQTTQNFVWIIKIDPQLDIHILEKLSKMILSSSVANQTFVVGSNVNYLTGHIKGGWRDGLESHDLLSNKIYTGDIEILHQASNAAQDKIVLETRLDADDGLHAHYLEFVQRDAKLKFSSGTFHFHYWCIESHIKWYIGNDYDDSRNYPQGMVEGERRLNFCMTPGLTIGMNIGYDVLDLPQYPHHELYWRLKNECLVISDSFGKFDSSGTNDTSQNAIKSGHHNCITFVTQMVSAVRSRTETSAGMEELQMHSSKNMEEQQRTLWNILLNHFGVVTETAIQTKQYFKENRIQIARENLLGQCLGDHSCKNSTKVRLQKIIDGVR